MPDSTAYSVATRRANRRHAVKDVAANGAALLAGLGLGGVQHWQRSGALLVPAAALAWAYRARSRGTIRERALANMIFGWAAGSIVRGVVAPYQEPAAPPDPTSPPVGG